ncbi:hypothetical protein CsSME_00038062 [Camellia sinensis var. sinensis]
MDSNLDGSHEPDEMWATHCNSFLHIPCNLLVSCIKHPDLTVDSEWHLADAFIVWLAANTEQFESSSSTRDDCNGILKENIFRKFGRSLLPVGNVVGLGCWKFWTAAFYGFC